MIKYFLSVAMVVALVGFNTGCRWFSNDTPDEDTFPVEDAYLDPISINSVPLGSGNSGWDVGGGSVYTGPGVFVEGATDALGSGDPDAWTLADTTGNRLNMPIIYFAYDSDILVPSERQNLDRIADYLARNRSLGLLIEGHCDQRGTEEYNRALGERRANAIRAYLADRGVENSRMKTLSYGKDKPAVEGTGETAWGQNRRGVPVPMRMPGR